MSGAWAFILIRPESVLPSVFYMLDPLVERFFEFPRVTKLHLDFSGALTLEFVRNFHLFKHLVETDGPALAVQFDRIARFVIQVHIYPRVLLLKALPYGLEDKISRRSIHTQAEAVLMRKAQEEIGKVSGFLLGYLRTVHELPASEKAS
jgi:hypothetical protein